jgi:branched-subunit amino acid aminotransferase/4-amino-4-deoxychorismate lyase
MLYALTFLGGTMLTLTQQGIHHNVPCEQVPPLGRGSMYLRPLLLGTGPTLGLQPAPEVTFVIFSAAVGSYFKGGTLAPIHLKIENRYHRAAPFGVGAAKCAGKRCVCALTCQIIFGLSPARSVCRTPVPGLT